MERTTTTIRVLTLLLSLVAACAGLWNGWRIARLTGQVEALQDLLVAHATTPGMHPD